MQLPPAELATAGCVVMFCLLALQSMAYSWQQAEIRELREYRARHHGMGQRTENSQPPPTDDKDVR